MSPAIAFFPWVHVDEPIEVGPVRLLPYAFRSLPGNLEYARQTDIDGVLRAYSSRPRRRVRRAAILEYGTWRLGTPADDHIRLLFEARELIAFSALASRRFFGGWHYTNFDSYALTVQKYAPGAPGTFAFTTRRRDGGATHLWGSDEFAFTMPIHVMDGQRMDLDLPLLDALLRVSSNWPELLEAIREFNAANTDAQGTQEHVELVLMKSAWEWLLGSGNRSIAFEKALVAAAGKSVAPLQEGPLLEEWTRQWGKADRLLAAWARAFSAARGVAAHGQRRGGRSVLSVAAHLAFSAFLFPLIVKKKLDEQGLYELNDRDRWRVENIDRYLAFDPFAYRVQGGKGHPWGELENASLFGVSTVSMQAALERALQKVELERGTESEDSPAANGVRD